MEYREENIAFQIRSIRESETVPVSIALRGLNPHATVAKMTASNNGKYSSSYGQLMKTDLSGG